MFVSLGDLGVRDAPWFHGRLSPRPGPQSARTWRTSKGTRSIFSGLSILVVEPILF